MRSTAMKDGRTGALKPVFLKFWLSLTSEHGDQVFFQGEVWLFFFLNNLQ